MDYQVGLTDAAIDDLGAIASFLAEKDPDAALRLGGELLDATLSLAICRGVARRCAAGPACASSPIDTS